MTELHYLLEVKNIIKDYPGVRAVDQACFNLKAGEVHALIGENGAGKSSLVKILAGVVQADSGHLVKNGEEIFLHSGQDAYRAGFSFIHQELNLIPYMNAAENVFLGHVYPKTRLGMVSWKKLHQKTREIFTKLGVSIQTDLPVSRLTPGEQSMVAIARAFATEAVIYVMDEPTASLSSKEVENLFKVIRTLKSQGKTVLYISHRLEEIFQITDRVTVMRDGKTVGTFPTNELDQDTLIRHMIGRKLDNHYPPRTTQTGSVILRASHAGNRNVQNISFELHAGEILGVAGLIGSGRSELLNILYGIDPLEQGELFLQEKPYHPHNPAVPIRNKVVLVPEERRTQGLIMEHSIMDNITLPHIRSLSRGGRFVNRTREQQVSRQVGEEVKLKAVSVKHPVSTLSGGNQQKVVFARWMVGEVNVLLLDEPTRGVDVGARYEIYCIIREMAEKGAGILLVSSDIQEIIGLSDRILVLRDGRLVKELQNDGLTQYQVLKHCYQNK